MLKTNELFKVELSRRQHQLTEEETARVKEIVLETFKDIRNLCDELGIPYMLGGGSVLGAVRHKGFIPWDDDIDLNIERKYLRRLVDALKSRYPDKYLVDVPGSGERYLSSFIEVHRKGTVLQEFLSVGEEYSGVKVDIFPIENTYNNAVIRQIHGRRVEAGLLILSCIRAYLWREEFFELTRGTCANKTFKVKAAIGAVFAPARHFWFRHIHKLMSACKDTSSKYVVIPTGRKHYFGEIYNRESYLNTIEVSFEDTTACITADYDNYLSNLYGNYMEIPPENKREHHVIYSLKL